MHQRSSILVAALFALAPGLRITAEEKPGPPAAAAPLVISISATQQEYTNAAPVFEVTLRNAGNEDLLVNLGMMLANGKRLLPDAIQLVLVDAEGHSRELRLGDTRVAGRVDDYIVPLRVGSTHSLRLSLGDYWCPERKEFRIRLKRGEYRVRAQLTSKGVQYANSDTLGMRLLNVWTGTVQSEVATFRVGGEE